MADAIYTTTLYTGKTWERTCQRQTGAGEAKAFDPADTLRAQIRDAPGGEPVATVTASITDYANGWFSLAMTDEETAKVPTAKQYGTVKTYWMDADLVKEDGRILRLLNIRLAVLAGVTEAG